MLTLECVSIAMQTRCDFCLTDCGPVDRCNPDDYEVEEPK